MKLFGQPEAPEPPKTMTVDELFKRLEGILTLDQLQSIWNAAQGDSASVTRELKDLLRPHEAVLGEQGFVPDFLAYLLPHVLGPHLEANRRIGPKAMWN